jgi:hypothetical protein
MTGLVQALLRDEPDRIPAAVHESRVTDVQENIERRTYFSDASVDSVSKRRTATRSVKP